MNSATLDLGATRFARAEALFAAACELPPEERRGFLDRECDDTELRAYVSSLLVERHPIESRIEATIVDAMTAVFSGEDDAGRYSGEMIGAYRVVRLLGSGGMGMVYLAERADGQFDQQVAIKLGRHRLVTPQAEQRLKSERQILADLDHPNIARLFDGGTTDDGVPYLVMEYVDGLPIDIYCDLHRVDVEGRLALFRTICEAVHYAHRNLVIHRDIKAANILVTDDGTPKLLDFGIAKLTDTQGAATDGLTREGAVIMTPANAAPEQLSNRTVTTATDTYALGLLLYRLLAGLPPYSLEGLSPAQFAQLVCDEEPLKPSQKLRRQAADADRDGGAIDRATVERTAFDRNTTVDRLVRRLRGDIDTIIMKALRKEPERRYESASALGVDVGLHLRAMPIVARSESWFYRAGRFMRRHYVAVTMSIVGALSLLAFSIVVVIQNQRIALERDTARAVSTMLEDIFKASDPSRARNADISAAEILASGTERIAGELADQPALRATLTGTIGRVYFGLGKYEPSREMLEEALAIRLETLGEAHPDVAAARTDLAELLIRTGEYDRARQLLRAALATVVAAHGAGSVQAARNLYLLAEVNRAVGDFDEAERFARSSIDIYAATGTGASLELAEARNLLARILQIRGDLPGTESLLRHAIATLREAEGEDHPYMAYYLQSLGVVLLSLNDLDGADIALAEATEVARRVLGEGHDLLAATLIDRGRVLHARGDHDQAIGFMQEALALDTRAFGEVHPRIGYDLIVLGFAMFDDGRHAPAEATFRRALHVVEEALGPDHQYAASALTGLGAVLNATDRVGEATPLLAHALEVRLRDYPADHALVAATRTEYADSLARSGRFDEAEQMLLQSLAVLGDDSGRRTKRALEVSGRLAALRERADASP